MQTSRTETILKCRFPIRKKQARRIAERVFEHYRDHAGLSLGVIAFSRKQAEAIEEEVQALRRHQPDFDAYFQEDVHEEFFVKSLENVQGDERDVIFLSVGYGPAADGSIYYNFGPLSQAKGERRLNVAVTCAKSHMKLVSSMLPEHLPETKVDGNSGVKHLKRYMQNVLQGRPSARTDWQNRPAPVFDSRVQANIFRVLSELGYIKGLKKKRF